MKRIPKDLADKMVMDVLVSISQIENVTSEFAKNSLDLMNDSIDNSILTGILLTKARPSVFNENEVDMKVTIMSALSTVFDMVKREDYIGFNVDLKDELIKSQREDCSFSTKMDFCVSQFVNAFYEYQRLENKYPELMKFM
jgi:hypothetical protein